VGLDDGVDGGVEEGGGSAAAVAAVVELVCDLPHGGEGLFVEVVDGDAGGENAVVGVDDVLDRAGGTM
jgi:hypothetical protein